MKTNNKLIIEILGVLAVVISLALVAVELRESRLTARAASYQEAGLAIAEIWAMAAMDDEMAEILNKAASPELEVFASLTEVELGRAGFLLISFLRIYEVLYLQIQEGLLDEEALDYLGYGELMYGTDFFHNLWPTVKVNVTPGLAAYLEEQAGI